MTDVIPVLILLAGAALGAVIAWLIFRPAVPAIGMAPTTEDDPDGDLKRRANNGQL